MSRYHCPSCGEVLATPGGATHCPLCGLPLLVTAADGHGLKWPDDANRVFPDPVLPDPTRLPDIPSDRERQQREAREQHT